MLIEVNQKTVGKTEKIMIFCFLVFFFALFQQFLPLIYELKNLKIMNFQKNSKIKIFK